MDMGELDLHFTDTFNGQTATVWLDDKEVLRAEGLKTDFRVGLARIVKVKSAKDSVTLSVEVSSIDGRKSEHLKLSELKYVVVSLVKGELRLKPISHEDFAREPRGDA
jgi:hypothetical protein